MFFQGIIKAAGDHCTPETHCSFLWSHCILELSMHWGWEAEVAYVALASAAYINFHGCWYSLITPLFWLFSRMCWEWNSHNWLLPPFLAQFCSFPMSWDISELEIPCSDVLCGCSVLRGALLDVQLSISLFKGLPSFLLVDIGCGFN